MTEGKSTDNLKSANSLQDLMFEARKTTGK